MNSACARIVVCCALTAVAGCWPAPPGNDPAATEQVLGYVSPAPSEPTASQTPQTDSVVPSTSTPAPTGAAGPQSDPSAPASYTETEPNDTWNQAEAVPFSGNVELIGTMSPGTAKDVDLFDLGPAASGQELQADLTNNGEDIQLGLLDDQQRILAYIDPLSPTAGPGRIDIVLHQSTGHLYVMVATRSTSASARDYRVVVSLSEATTVPSSHPQAVVLVFQGANQVRIGSRPPVNVPAFDIGTINSEFTGQTEDAITLLMQKVREQYAGLNVTFYRDTDPDRPADGFTSIYFGTSDPRLLGLADNVDPFNSNPVQSAIIYTDTFSLFNQLQPGLDSMVQVLANVTSHETGHLLGLRHVADPEEIMDVTATARQMLADQQFKTSPLHISVLPLGFQDAPTMLAWSVGGELQPTVSTKLYAQHKPLLATAGDDFYIPRSMLADCGCPECDQAYRQAAGH